MNELEGYEQDLMTRGGGAVKPLTWTEKWNATVEATGLTAVGGLDNLRVNAYLDLRQAVQNAYPDQALEEVASSRGLNFGPMIAQPGQRVSPRALMDQNAAVLNSLIETLPEDKRRNLAPLQDLDVRAEAKAAEIEKRDAEAAAQTYGLSGHAWAFLASAWGVMNDPVNLSAMAITAPFGGPLTAVGRQALTAAVTQIPISVEVQRRRRELGLEAGFQPAAAEVGMAAGTAGAISLVAKGGAAAFGWLGRAAARAPAVRGVPTPEPRVEAPPGAPAAPTAPAPPVRPPEEQLPFAAPERPPAAPAEPMPVTAEQVAAAELLHERDRVILDAPARPQTIAGKELHERQVVEAATALEQARSPDRRVSSVTDDGPPRLEQSTSGGRVTVEAREGATTGPVPFAPQFAGSRAQWFESAEQQLIRPTGERMTVRPMVVELADVVASHDLEGRPNPAYPVKELQPRDRSAMASRLFVREKAAQLEPELLGDAPTAGTGSPVIGPDGIVESGNGRVLLLQQAYAEHPDRIAAYQQFLRDRGYALEGFKQPVLIRMREGELTMAERGRFALEANISPTAGLSPRERAFADAKFLDDVMLSRHAGGDVTLTRNQAFARAFADQAVAPEERPNFMTADNTLSAEGARRIEAALVARAYGADDVISGLYEATDSTSKSILGGLADAAPTVTRLKLAIEAGTVPPEADPTPALLEGFRQVEAARRAGFRIGEVIYQADLERGAVPEDVIAATRLYFRNAEMTQAAGRDTIAERIESAANRAMNQVNALGDLFGDAPPTGTASLQSAVLAGTNLSHLEVGGAGRELIREAVKNKWTREQISNLEQVKAAQAHAESLPRTDQAEGYLSDAWKRNREFRFELEPEPGGTPRFETVTGYDNGIVRLEGKAASYAEGNLKSERTAWLVLGPPAAGKSSFAEEIARKVGAAIVDSDDAKKVLPEFRGGVGASAVHEESSYLAAEVQLQFMERGENIILPRVGNNADKMVRAIENLQSKGYKVNVVHVYVEENEAYRRMISRWLSSQRLIDARYIEEVDGNTGKSYISIKERASLNDAAEIDATGPRGAHVLTDGDGELAKLLDSSLRPEGAAPGVGPGRGGAAERGGDVEAPRAAAAGGRAPAEGAPVEPTPEQIEAVRRNAGSDKALQYLAEARARREAREAIGDKVLAADAERALEDAGGDVPDLVIRQADGTEVRMTARQALDEARADATAHDEFLNCIGTTLEGA
jgi:hypothetical protein